MPHFMRCFRSRESFVSTTTSVKKRFSIFCSFASPIAFWNRSGTGITSRVCRSRWQRSFGIEGRGKFYDDTGAIRDVVENHMLQVVAFLAMEAPTGLYCDAIRDEQVKVFRTISPLDPKHLVRGQFECYKSEKGVDPDSK